MIEAEQQGVLADYSKLLDQDAWKTLGFIKGDDQNNNLTGNDLSNYLAGNTGNDHLYGANGNDVLNGGEGDDYLSGGNHDDLLDGGLGDDVLYGENGNDTLNGGEGNDRMYGGAGSDTLDGGAGNDRLEGGDDADTYLFAQGHGKDTVSDYTYTEEGNNTLRFNGAVSAEARFGREGDALTVNAYGEGDQVNIEGYFSNGNNRRYELVFDDAAVGEADIREKAISVSGNDSGNQISGWDTADTVNGLGGNDTLYGYNGNDVLNGGEGDDYLVGGDGNDRINGEEGSNSLVGDSGDDTLSGGESDDKLYGGDGSDTLDGGAGNDRLEGGDDADTYLFAKGHGNDIVSDYDSHVGNMDTLRFEGILSSEVQFIRDGNDLVLSGYQDSDSVRIGSFFNSQEHKIERFVFDDIEIENPDFTVYLAQADQMIQTMSIFGHGSEVIGSEVQVDPKPVLLAASV